MFGHSKAFPDQASVALHVLVRVQRSSPSHHYLRVHMRSSPDQASVALHVLVLVQRLLSTKPSSHVYVASLPIWRPEVKVMVPPGRERAGQPVGGGRRRRGKDKTLS